MAVSDRVERTWEGPTYVRWGAVLSGALIGLGVVVLLNLLWFALAAGDQGGMVERNLHWYAMGSAIAGLLLGSMASGWIAGVRGMAPGIMNGLSVWGVILIATIAVGVPSVLAVFDFTAEPLAEWGADPAWAGFWAVLGGLVLAVVGGLIGGMIPRPTLAAPRGAHYADERDRYDRTRYDDDRGYRTRDDRDRYADDDRYRYADERARDADERGRYADDRYRHSDERERIGATRSEPAGSPYSSAPPPPSGDQGRTYSDPGRGYSEPVPADTRRTEHHDPRSGEHQHESIDVRDGENSRSRR